MPIKGLSETRRLPRLGKIHIGIKKTKVVEGREVTFPSAVDYFVFPVENPLHDELVRIFGEKPRELRILIPVEEEERWCSQYYRAYSQTRGLICKGDGDTALRMVDAHTGALVEHDTTEIVLKEVRCLGRDCPDYERSCREIMNLQFLLPEIPGLGIWQIDTSSINSIRNINSAADLVRRVYGRVSMIPLILAIEPREVQDGEGRKRTVHVLNLRTNRTLLEMMETVAKPTPEMISTKDTELPVPDDETPEMVIPQAQEEKVTEQAKAEPQKDGGKAKRKTKDKPAIEAGAKDPEATREEKQEIIKALRKQGKTDDEIRDRFYTVTGKKGTWLRSDIEKLRKSLQEGKKSPEEEADEFIKELEG